MHVCVHVGEYLARGFHTPEETEENDDPGDRQAAQDGQMHFPKVPNIVGDVQHVVPRVARSLLTTVNFIYKQKNCKKNKI